MEYEVTVVIPTYNRSSYLPQALDSVIGQSYKKWKILIVDDGSTDDTITKIESYLRNPRVKLIRNPQNVGVSKSLNAALASTDTPYMVQLDSDDWYYPYTLEVLVKEAKKQPDDVAVISGNITIIFENPQDEPMNSQIHKGRLFINRYDFLLANLSLWPRFYRTTALKNIGGWPTDDPFAGRYMEDKRILFRLVELYRFHWIDQELYIHRRHSGNQTNAIHYSAEMTEWGVRDTLKRWGDLYEPVFETYGRGWKRLVRLDSKNQTSSQPLIGPDS